MYYREHKIILIVGVCILFLILGAAAISTFWPRYEERFFELGLLGRDMKAEGYFLEDNSTIEAGSEVLWYINIHNHMGSSQNVSVRVKILNSTMELPDDREHEPSPLPFYREFFVSLSVDSTKGIPLSWGIAETVSGNDSLDLKSLFVNGQMVDVNVISSDSLFRMVFELWVYDQFSREYKFGWESGEEFSSASCYIGFRVV